MLEVEGVYKHFGGIHAVRGASFDVKRGSITALIGPNGAGKTTLFNIVTGFYRPDAGRIVYDGKSIFGARPYAIARRGMVRTFQITKALAAMPVIDNMMLAAADQPGEHLPTLLGRPLAGRKREAEVREQAMELLATFNLDKKADDYAGTLSGGQRKLLELARALMPRAADGPARRADGGDQPDARTAPARAHGASCARNDGVTFLFVEHDMDVVMNHSDEVVVMGQGETIARRHARRGPLRPAGDRRLPRRRLRRDRGRRRRARLRSNATRRARSAPMPAEANGRTLLKAEGLVAGYTPEVDILDGVELEVREGEIVTIVGPNGAGKSTLMKTIFGLVRPRAGSVSLDGDDITGKAPHTITRKGVTYVSQLDNVFPSLTVRENLELGAIAGGSGSIDSRRGADVRALPAALGAAQPGGRARCPAASGRWSRWRRALMPDPQLVLVDEPSAGLAPAFVDAIFEKLVEINERRRDDPDGRAERPPRARDVRPRLRPRPRQPTASRARARS